MHKNQSIKIDGEKLKSVIRKARRSHGMSQIYLGNILGVSQKSYSVIESGNGIISIVNFLKLIHILELDPMELIDNIVITNPSWKPYGIYREEKELKIRDLECRICDLQSENAVLREQNIMLVNKLCKNEEN